MRNVEAALHPISEAGAASHVSASLDATRDARSSERRGGFSKGDVAIGAKTAVIDQIRPRNHEPRHDEPYRSCEAAALFVDIVGYSRMSEALSPSQMLEVLGYFYEAMTKVTQLYGGHVERYDGDALFVTFGTRQGDGQVATAALRCAFEMRDVVAHWSRKRCGAGRPGITIAIGIDYGPVAIAQLKICGDRRRTLQGDAVNVARKLEGLTRELDVCLVASDRMVDAAIAEGRSNHLLAQMHENEPRQVGCRVAPIAFWSLANAASHCG